MKDAGVAATDINEVLLVGGMTRMPRVSPLPTVCFFLPCCPTALSLSAPPIYFLLCAVSQLCLILSAVFTPCCLLPDSFVSLCPTLDAVFTS